MAFADRNSLTRRRVSSAIELRQRVTLRIVLSIQGGSPPCIAIGTRVSVWRASKENILAVYAILVCSSYHLLAANFGLVQQHAMHDSLNSATTISRHFLPGDPRRVLGAAGMRPRTRLERRDTVGPVLIACIRCPASFSTQNISADAFLARSSSDLETRSMAEPFPK